MSNSILDNRILVDNADALDPAGNGLWENEAGGTMGFNLSTTASGAEEWVEGTAAISDQASGAGGTTGLLFNTEVTNDWSGNVIYIWINMIQTGVVDTQVLGGITVRFTGATVTDWFEVYVAGSDTYGGGWTMFVVDVELARANAVAGILGGTNGTTPAVNAIQRVGAICRTNANAPGANDNFIVDAIWRLPAGQPGVIFSGVNTTAGSPGTPWTMEDLLFYSDNTDTTKAWGVAERLRNGTISLNTPLAVGAAGSPHYAEFLDTNEVVGWEDQLVPDDFYKISAGEGSPALNANSRVRTTIGIKSGTGTDATGAQGFVITTGGPRWNMDFSDPNQTLTGLFGCSLIGSNVLDLREKGGTIESISTLYIDGVIALIHDSTQLKISVVNYLAGSPIGPGSPNIPTETGYMHTNDITDISFSTFAFNYTHGIVLSGLYGSPTFLGSPSIPNTQTSSNNTFIGYAASGSPKSAQSVDAAIYNRTGKTITINSSGDSGLSYRDSIGSPPGSNTIVVADPVTTLITVLDATTQLPVKDARVWVNDTGSPITTYLFGTGGTLTDINGQVSDSRVLGADLPISGRVRRATRTLGSPLNETFYKTGIISGTVDSATGFTTTVFLIPDE